MMDRSQSKQSRVADSGRQPELTHLAETYAIRVREFSDAVATLGRRIAARKQIGENLTEVERLKGLVEQASEELLDALESPESRFSAA